MALQIDIDSLTLGDIEDVEDAVGKPIAEVFDHMSAKAITALVWVVRRREDPAFTLDNARALRMGDVEVVGGGELPPTVAAG